MDITNQLLYDRILELEKKVFELESLIKRQYTSIEPSDIKPMWLVDWSTLPTYELSDSLKYSNIYKPEVKEECKTCEGGKCTNCPWFTYVTYTTTTTDNPEPVKGGFYKAKYYTMFTPNDKDK